VSPHPLYRCREPHLHRTTNFQTFSKCVQLRRQRTIAYIGIVIALISGMIGGHDSAMMAAMLPNHARIAEI